MKKTGLFALVFLFVVSCQNEPDCYQLNNNMAVVYFKILGSGNDVIQVLSITSPETDSVFYSDEALSYVELPLNPKDEETTFTLQTTEDTKTLRLGYKRQVQFVSESCGERYYYQGLNVLEHDYDSVRVISDIPAPWPVPSGSKSIEVYRCAVTDLMWLSFTTETFVEEITGDFATIELPPDGMLKDFLVPLNTMDSTTTYQFDFGDEIKTIRVRYSRTKKKFADICGEQSLMYNLRVNTAVTDMVVKITNDSIQDLPVKNLEITPP